jgi:predicted ester cyclase
MTALEAFRRFQEFRRLGQFDHIAEVLDTENYVENCVGFTGWTLGFDTALANFEHGIRAIFSNMSYEEQDIIEDGKAVMIRLRTQATHTGKPFFGIPASGRRVTYDVIDMYRVGEDGRINFRFMLCDWNGVRQQLLGEAPDLPTTPSRVAVQAINES